MAAERREMRYATPSLVAAGSRWHVRAHPWNEHVGWIYDNLPSGWTAFRSDVTYAGLWPTKQAAAEVLVKQAGYEVGEI